MTSADECRIEFRHQSPGKLPRLAAFCGVLAYPSQQLSMPARTMPRRIARYGEPQPRRTSRLSSSGSYTGRSYTGANDFAVSQPGLRLSPQLTISVDLEAIA